MANNLATLLQTAKPARRRQHFALGQFSQSRACTGSLIWLAWSQTRGPAMNFENLYGQLRSRGDENRERNPVAASPLPDPAVANIVRPVAFFGAIGVLSGA